VADEPLHTYFWAVLARLRREPDLDSYLAAAPLDEDDPDRARHVVEVGIGGDEDDHALLVWEDSVPVCMAGCLGPTPNGITILSVYTPPEHRGRGYASACVAALTQRLLERGRRRVFLSTDLSNPTSNAIYQRIGYAPAGDLEVLTLS
jgi:predicted GNAT family acetyltransferase